MMFVKFVLVCALVAAPALAKTLPARESEQKELEKTSPPQREELSKTSHKVEQLKVEQVEQVEQREQQREEITQLKDEEVLVQQQLREEAPAQTKGEPLRYEAKPQISRDELAKGQPELPKALPKGYNEPPRAIEEPKYEQQEQLPVLQEQVEVKQEEYIEQAPTKGGPAPLGMAEPYAFSYQVDGSSRSESGDTNGVVRGQYTLQGAGGSSRVVEYIADHNGFRASVNTNEFGTENASPAGVALRTSQPSAESISRGLEPAQVQLAGTKTSLREEAPRVTQVLYEAKGAAPAAPLAPAAPAIPAPLEKARPLEEAPRKGHKELELPQRQEQHQEWDRAEPVKAEPIKSAQLRAPKAVGASKQLNRSFQSATAHRVVPAVVPVRPVAPAAVVRHQPVVRGPIPVAPVVRGPSYVREPSYLPSPVLVQPAYRRPAVPVVHEHNPRVSFYRPEEDHSGFL